MYGSERSLTFAALELSDESIAVEAKAEREARSVVISGRGYA